MNNPKDGYQFTSKELLTLPEYNCGSTVKISKFLLIISCVNTGSVLIYKDYGPDLNQTNLVVDFPGYNETQIRGMSGQDLGVIEH